MAQNKGFRIMVLGALACLFLPMVIYAQVTIRFEGIDNYEPVGTVDGVVFGQGWTAVVDSDAGGTGSFANEPSPSTGAVLSNDTSSALDRRISFPQPVRTVSFFYTLYTDAGTPVVSFYSSDDAFLGTATMDVCGNTFCGSGCTGDPNGLSCSWTELVFTSSSSYVSYLEFSSTDLEFPTINGEYFIIDNLTLQDPLNTLSKNGFWATPGQVGGAVAIDIRGNQLAVGWGAYDDQTGESSWMYSEGVMTSASHYTGPLWQFANGQCFDCPYTPPTVQNTVGTISITFLSETSAIINALGITKVVEKVE